MTNKIPMVEIFGPTIQGEGFHIGTPTIFVRTGGCDYHCEWCDSLYAVDKTKYGETWQMLEASDIMNQIKILSPKPILITISGGNPALHNLEPLIDLGHKAGYTFTIETQGTVSQSWFPKLDHIIISPKPPSSGMVTDFQKLDKCVAISKKGINEISIKVVVSNEEDYEYAKIIFDRYPTIPHFITPCNLHPGEPVLDDIYNKTKDILEMIINDKRFDITILPQLHVLLWGNERMR